MLIFFISHYIWIFIHDSNTNPLDLFRCDQSDCLRIFCFKKMGWNETPALQGWNEPPETLQKQRGQNKNKNNKESLVLVYYNFM